MGTTVIAPRLVADALSFAALLLTMTVGRSKAAYPIGFARSTIQISPPARRIGFHRAIPSFKVRAHGSSSSLRSAHADA